MIYGSTFLVHLSVVSLPVWSFALLLLRVSGTIPKCQDRWQNLQMTRQRHQRKVSQWLRMQLRVWHEAFLCSSSQIACSCGVFWVFLFFFFGASVAHQHTNVVVCFKYARFSFCHFEAFFLCVCQCALFLEKTPINNSHTKEGCVSICVAPGRAAFTKI